VKHRSVFSDENKSYFILSGNFKDSKGVIRSRKSKKDMQFNCQQKKDKDTNNDLIKHNYMYT